jgi:hypothetical protein
MVILKVPKDLRKNDVALKDWLSQRVEAVIGTLTSIKE